MRMNEIEIFQLTAILRQKNLTKILVEFGKILACLLVFWLKPPKFRVRWRKSAELASKLA